MRVEAELEAVLAFDNVLGRAHHRDEAPPAFGVEDAFPAGRIGIAFVHDDQMLCAQRR
ncbi:hypothetical protein D3C72_2327300 [compost metagenome]